MRPRKIFLDFVASLLYIHHMKFKKPWTSEERYILKKQYKTADISEILKLLPNRTKSSIYSQISYLRKRGWTFG